MPHWPRWPRQVLDRSASDRRVAVARRPHRRLLVVTRLAFAACVLVMLGGADAQDAIKARKDNFHVLSVQMRNIIKGLGDGLPVPAMRGWAVKAQLALQRVPSLFPDGSGMGKTRALPLIWSEPARFTLAYQAAAARMSELVAAAQDDDRDAFGAAAGRMTAACGNCHSRFRAD